MLYFYAYLILKQKPHKRAVVGGLLSLVAVALIIIPKRYLTQVKKPSFLAWFFDDGNLNRSIRNNHF